MVDGSPSPRPARSSSESAQDHHVSAEGREFLRSSCHRCLENHLGVLQTIVTDSCSRALILEGDTEFAVDVQDAFGNAVATGLLPKDWDILYRGGAHLVRALPGRFRGRKGIRPQEKRRRQ